MNKELIKITSTIPLTVIIQFVKIFKFGERGEAGRGEGGGEGNNRVINHPSPSPPPDH